MKTAISIPDPIFQAAEEAAARLAMSRSQLYTAAVAAFVQLHTPAQVTEQLDQVYSENPSALDPVLAKLQNLSLAGESW
jgi:metal-responsive CopG/Arc/MetJ family transcriptional regulator